MQQIVFGNAREFLPRNEFELVSQNELGEPAMTIPAFQNDRIYIRGENHLFCIGS